MSVEFRFHSEKVVEAASWLLHLHGEPMKYLGLLKMLYIADRKALERMDETITGDSAYSMAYGPVLSATYDLIKGNDIDKRQSIWNKHISKRFAMNHKEKKNYVKLIEMPLIQKLCEEEEEILTEVYKEFGQLDPFTVAKWTHSLPEWQDPENLNKKSIPISFEDVLKFLSRSDEEIDNIKDAVKRETYLDNILNAYSY